MKINKILLFYLVAIVSLVKATTTNNDGHGDDNYNDTSTTNSDGISPLFRDTPEVGISSVSSLLPHIHTIDQQQELILLLRGRGDNHVNNGGGEVYVGVGGGGGGGGGGDGHDHGGHPGGGGRSNQLQLDWMNDDMLQLAIYHTTAHSVEMVQYGQTINIDVSSSDTPQELNDRVHDIVGLPPMEEEVLHLYGGGDNEFMPDNVLGYDEEKEEEKADEASVENVPPNESLPIQPLPSEIQSHMDDNVPIEPTPPTGFLGKLRSSPLGKLVPKKKKRTRSARSPASPPGAAAAAAAARNTSSGEDTALDIDEVVLNYSETSGGRGELDIVDESTIDVDSDERLLNMDMEMTSAGEEPTKNKKKASVNIISMGTSTHFAQGKMKTVYDKLVGEFDQLGDQDDETMKMREFLIRLASYVNSKEIDIMSHPDRYLTSEARTDLEQDFNDKRDELIAVMKKTLENNDDHRLISLGTRFSQLTRIIFLLHYAPVGVRHVDGDEVDRCHPRQCCIATMFKKIPNFLSNEDKNVEMSEYRYGGRDAIDSNSSSKMVVSDLIPFLLEKGEDEKDMVVQYESWAKKLNLRSYDEMMTISYNIARMHLLLHRVSHPELTCQVHVASAATAKYMFGLGRGVNKYLTRLMSDRMKYIMTFGPHPQVYLMGLNKSRRMFPDGGVRETIAQNLVQVYRNIHKFKDNFTSEILNIFGKDCADGVNVGAYSHLARLLDDSNLLHLDTIVQDTTNFKQVKDMFRQFLKLKNKPDYVGILSSSGWDKVDIELFMTELDEAGSIDMMMKRMRKFRAGARLHYIAAQLPPEGEAIPNHINAMIDGVTSILGKGQDFEKSRKRIVSSLRRIQRNQRVGGDRLTQLSQLAAKANRGEDVTDDELAQLVATLADGRGHEDALAMIERAVLRVNRFSLLNQLAAKVNREEDVTDDELDQLVATLADGRGHEDALAMIERAAEEQLVGGDRLSLLSQLAAKVNREEDVTDDELAQLVAILADGRGHEDALAMIERAVQEQLVGGERLTLLNKLVEKYNRAGGKDGDGEDAISNTAEFTNFVNLLADGTGKDTAMKMVEKVAVKCDSTFWKYYKELKEYKKDKGTRTVKDKNGSSVEVLFVSSGERVEGVQKYKQLHKWFMEQINYKPSSNAYSVKAFQRKGSIEYDALVELGVSFDDHINQKAYEANIKGGVKRMKGKYTNLFGKGDKFDDLDIS